MKKDKKNINKKINLILLKKVGKIANANKFFFSDIEVEKFIISFYK
jgi:3-dehydroquinate synthetase